MLAPSDFRNWPSNESLKGTSSLTWFFSMERMVRSVRMKVPALIQVCCLPSRTKVSLPMKWTQASVTGRRINTVSPACNREGSPT